MNDLGNILFEFISKLLIEELKSQGHKLTGALARSFEYEIKEKTDSISFDFLMLKYGLSLNKGIKPSRIPYSRPSGRGGTSKYIEGLIRFAQIKFRADKRRAKQIAFAIAEKQKREGFPLTGKIGFIDNVLNGDQKSIENIVQNYFEASIDLLIQETIKEIK